jgi:C-terminal processing protease CtpA/Prc
MAMLANGVTAGQNAISDPKKVWEVRIDKIGNKKILYVSITSFPSSRDLAWNGFIESVKAHLRESSVMVIDLRGNGGGDDAKGYELAELAFGGKFDHPVNREYFSQTPETFIIAANGRRLQALYLKNQNASVPSYFAALHQEAMAKYQLAIEGKLPAEQVIFEEPKNHKFNPRTGYNKPIFILMDGGCGSSCESTIDAFETNPRVRKVGVHTIGMIHFGNVGALVLPNSKIHVQMATKYDEYFDKRFIERSGIKPNLEVPPGEDAYKFLLKSQVMTTATAQHPYHGRN